MYLYTNMNLYMYSGDARARESVCQQGVLHPAGLLAAGARGLGQARERQKGPLLRRRSPDPSRALVVLGLRFVFKHDVLCKLHALYL